MADIASASDSVQYSLLLAAGGEPGATEVSFSHLLIAFGVIAAESAAAHYLEIGLGDQLLVAGMRAFLQLNALGYILAPIFASSNPYFVLLYIFGFMVLVSSYEAAARPKVTYPALFRDAVKTTACSLLATGTLMLIIVRPTPWYNAQYLIPVAGMLISNSLTGNALALNGLLEHLTTRKEEVEVLLSFGATKWEACWPGFTNIFRTALIPAINGLNIIGLVSIPGMMTGQILGGSSPEKAARYQIVITFLISGSNFISVGLIMALTVSSVFDKRGRLSAKSITKQQRVKVAQFFSPSEWKKRRIAAEKARIEGKAEPLLAAASDASLDIVLRPSRKYGESAPVLLDINMETTIAESRPLAARLQLHTKEIAVIMGSSGIGKSTLLRMVCDLQDQDSATILLQAKDMKTSDPMQWRRDVLYLHQAKAPLPGSPKDLITNIDKFKVNMDRRPFQPSKTLSEKMSLTSLLEGFGLSETYLERPWNELSGGEAQRMMIAIGLATKPRVLLLDEPTSALDDASKRLVEEAIQDVDCAVLWVTHDEQQANRVGGSIWRMVDRSTDAA